MTIVVKSCRLKLLWVKNDNYKTFSLVHNNSNDVLQFPSEIFEVFSKVQLNAPAKSWRSSLGTEGSVSAHAWDQTTKEKGEGVYLEHVGDETSYKLLKKNKIRLLNSHTGSSKTMGKSLQNYDEKLLPILKSLLHYFDF